MADREEFGAEEAPVQLNASCANVVVVDNVPVTGMERYEKLYAVIRKIFSSYGTIIDDGLYIPVTEKAKPEDKQMTCGYAFIEYETAEMATRAVLEGNNKKLDNAHTLLVNHYDDFDKYGKVQPEYTPPKKSDYESKVNLNSWLLDEQGRDMFVLRAGSETQVFHNDPFKKATEYGRELKYAGEREKANDKTWTDLYVAWSPKGSYLLTFHNPGVVIWGGENFEKLGRFPHAHVNQIDFSPNEKYIITSNGNDRPVVAPGSNPAPGEAECYIVWDVRSGKKLRGFDKEKSDVSQPWPVFKFSHDDKFLARKGVDAVSVYETPTMGLLDKKSIKIQGVQDCVWSPAANLLAYWVPEKSNGPASVGVIELPSRTVKREKHLFNVIDIKLHWHPQGDYLCVKVARRKTKKTVTTNFEIFRVRQKDMPIETLELEVGVVAFAWEPHGHRFAIIQTGGEGTKNNVRIYSVKGKEVKLQRSFDNRMANALFWSPMGGHLVLAGLGPFNGALEWIDVENGESLTPATQEHFQCGDVEWDPSGRFVITSATQPIEGGNWKYTMDNGYNLWSMQGQLLSQVKVDNCYQVMWRPRPTQLLSKEQVAALKASLKEKYWARFEKEDDAIRQSQLSGAAKERAELKAAWRAFRQAKEKEFAEERDMRRDLRGGQASDDEDDYVTVEQQVEEEVSREEELWQKDQ